MSHHHGGRRALTDAERLELRAYCDPSINSAAKRLVSSPTTLETLLSGGAIKIEVIDRIFATMRSAQKETAPC